MDKKPKEKILFLWSGGKDSAMALYELMSTRSYEVSALITTITEDFDRVSMHGIRRIFLEQQAHSIGLPLERIYISKDASNHEYEEKIKEKLLCYKEKGILSVAFGDIFLEDIRTYREENLSRIGMKGLFPLWKRDTTELARRFIKLGFKAVITCVDSYVLDRSFAGRPYDERFLRDLPPGIDPCGENGEFHTFVYDGLIFRKAIPFKLGEVVLRDSRFYFCDLIPLLTENVSFHDNVTSLMQNSEGI